MVLMFAGGGHSVMAGRTTVDDAFMAEQSRLPGHGGMTGFAGIAGANMVGVLARGQRTVVAGGAASGDALVTAMGRLPCGGDMAGFAVVTHRNVGGIFSRRYRSVVARRTTVEDAIVREERRLPALGGVAGIAVLPGDNVRGRLADRLDVVVATAATSQHLPVVVLHRGLERLGGMATLAAVRAQHMRRVLGCGGDTAAPLMATGTGTGRALEHCVDVTTLAGHIVVTTDQFKPRGEVVERAADDRPSRCAPPQPHEPEANTERLQPATVKVHFSAPERRCGAAPLKVRVE